MMRFSTLLRNPAPWMCGTRKLPGIVISSRIRLARNLADYLFPTRADASVREAVREAVLPGVRGIPGMEKAFVKVMEALPGVERRVLVERHLVSREHAGAEAGGAVVINRPQSMSIMINEEDHLRMQAMLPGFDLRSAFTHLQEADQHLEQQLDFAFDQRLGYLTSCPSNVGTGMRASVMLPLPGLVLADQMNKVINAINKIGLAVRGLFGEGSEAQSNLFQVSNQTTLGESEAEIIDRLERVAGQIIQNEIQARAKLLAERPDFVRDQVGRAYGLLRHARIIATKEALNHLSMLRLAIDLGWLPPQNEGDVNLDLVILDLQPAHMQWHAGHKLSPEERDMRRARLLRERLHSLPEPDMQGGAEDASADTPPNES